MIRRFPTAPARLLAPLSAALVLLLPCSSTPAQVRFTPPGAATRAPARADNPADKTTVSVELLAGREGVGIKAQQWSRVFEQVGVALRIRTALLDDKPEIIERKVGTLRLVTAIGRLERNGDIIFPDRSFSLDDGPKLKEWIDSLRTYGAQGSPEGEPLWGLNKSQFGALYSSLSQKLDEPVAGKSLRDALSRFSVSERYPLKFSTAAQTHVAQAGVDLHVRYEVKGLSQGTALAILLNDLGLGYRPLRTPEGAIELVLEPLDSDVRVWPVGWEQKLTNKETAPQLYQLVPVELDDAPFLDVLTAVAAKTEIPIHLDHHRIRGKKIDLEELRVSYPSRKTSWSILLRGITLPNKLTRRVRIDELGQPFVWISTLEAGTPDP